jgi:CheY-like chemotaxis protein
MTLKYKNPGDYQSAVDMSRSSLMAPNEASVQSTYPGLSLIVFPSFSKLLRASGVSRVQVGNDSTRSDSELHRIMIVDDEKDITMVFRSALERAGFRVEVFNNPLDALSHFKPDYYDLLLLDVRMPQMSGFELYQEIMKKDNTVKTCFISAFEVYKEELKKYMPDKEDECIIRKPISTRDLVKIIKEELG